MYESVSAIRYMLATVAIPNISVLLKSLTYSTEGKGGYDLYLLTLCVHFDIDKSMLF